MLFFEISVREIFIMKENFMIEQIIKKGMQLPSIGHVQVDAR